jgi:hypothetical protein
MLASQMPPPNRSCQDSCHLLCHAGSVLLPTLRASICMVKMAWERLEAWLRGVSATMRLVSPRNSCSMTKSPGLLP